MIPDLLPLWRAVYGLIPEPSWAWLRWLWLRLDTIVVRSFLDGDGRYYWPTFFFALAVLAIGFALRPDWRNRWPGGFLRFCFPAGAFTHRSTITDIQINVVNILVTPLVNIFWRFSSAWFTALYLGWLIAAFGPPAAPMEWTFGTILLATLVYALLNDFGYWVWHWIGHNVPFFWHFHKVHHSAEVLTPLVAGRVHPVEAMLLPIFRNAAIAIGLAPSLYLFGIEAPALTIFGMGLVSAFFALIGDQLFHAHVPVSWGPVLNRIIISPATHQIHHSVERRHWDTNLGGFFALWDWIFGTLYLPDSKQVLRYGVRDDLPQPHPGLLAAYFEPFLSVLRSLRQPRTLLWRRPQDDPSPGTGD